MNYSIRKATESDMPQVLALIQELANFEKESNAVEMTVEELVKQGFGAQPAFQCFVADSDSEILGMALVYPRFSTWVGTTIHLEDLIVTEKARGTGVGSALYKQVMSYAAELGVKRVEWAVLDWNEPAINFYEKSGAIVMRDWDTVQMREQELKDFLSK
ncbi:GNAT family N-acetyltransferase [Spongiivirga citrea]|uniref:GNAT family N-acetyltransferase n=1 Tax=Spongiivirga citrea TaxID=1481457 RepID=A0A6M0CR81_9FLAO|nr:GNAT family N-acetyltransferase [Spongiivirga citrea]NER18027.1 GNAT family N-acetyltransferase [Spongiivirga citrea]